MVRAWIILLALSFPALAAELSVPFCRLAQRWRTGHFHFQELCDRYPGNFCLGLHAEGQAICREGGGRYCDTVTSTGQALCLVGDAAACILVKNTAQGICLVLGGNQCLQRPNREENLWVRKLEAACLLNPF